MTPWVGKLLGLLAGVLLLRPPLFGALVGVLIGHALDMGWFRRRADDPYRVLGLTEDASDVEVERAWRRLASRYHPDRAGAGDELRHAEDRMREINRAYDRIQALRRRR
ncbi:MAG: J domain-containing protein [Lysobacter sp.]|nr:J domain-containing protein [Lysobacter sp.]